MIPNFDKRFWSAESVGGGCRPGSIPGNRAATVKNERRATNRPAARRPLARDANAALRRPGAESDSSRKSGSANH